MIRIQVTEQPIYLNAALKELPDPKHGAQIVFTGVVRENNLGKKVSGVSYDAFKPLAEKIFAEICQEAEVKWGALKIILIHRVGKLGIGEISLLIAVGSPHRDEGYQASRFILEEIKHKAPIWKKEHYLDGDSEWLQGHALCQHEPRNAEI